MANSGQAIGKDKPAIYESVPPEWLPQVSNSGDLGYQGFFPPNPTLEDSLSESNVKQGLQLKSSIPAETFSSKTRYIQDLKDDSHIHDLEDFMNQIFRRRADNVSQIPPSTFRIPSRVTLNDVKKNAWFSDLANPQVPLYKLGKSIPHGLKGHDLLDYLHAHNVAMSRAVWFIRVYGSNETAGLRNKPNYNPTQYSVEWANIMTGYLKKQLSDIALPMPPRPGLNIRQTFKGVLSDPDSRDRWVSKFIYSLELLRIFYAEYMVDHATFLSWLVQTLATCNHAQAGFAARLMDDFHSDLYSCRALTKPLVRACLTKLREISLSPSKDTLNELHDRLEDLLRRTFLTSTTSFVSPKIWKKHSETISIVLIDRLTELSDSNADAHVKHGLANISAAISETLSDVERRNEALLFRTSTQPVKGYLRSMVFDVQLLNSITSSTDMSSITFFNSRAELGALSSFMTNKLQLLLSWSVCPVQYGDHRPYAAMSLLRAWRDRAEARASRRDCASPNEVIQDELFDWLDDNEYAGEAGNLPAVSLLFGELVEKGLFSYDQYIQRIIARGETGLSFSEEPGSRHRNFLRVIPLYKADPALVNQRRMALYGVRARTIPEDQIEANLKAEIKNLLPEIFGEAPAQDMPHGSIAEDSILRTAARYEQIRVLKNWFMPNVRKFLSRTLSSPAEITKGVLRAYYVLVDILEVMKCFRTMLEITLDVVKQSSTTDLLMASVESLRRGMNLWTCMDAVNSIVQGLHVAHHAWKARGVHIRCLVNLLLEIDGGRYLDDIARHHVIEDAAHFAQALSPQGNQDPVPSALPEIQLLAQHPNPDAVSTLANTLWYKYRTSANWVWVIWDNVITALRNIPVMFPDVAERRACALRYGKFLSHIDLHNADGIDFPARQWFAGPGFHEIRTLSADAWDVVHIVFLHLAVHGALKIATLLHGVIYPAWTIGSSLESPSRFAEEEVFLRTANALCWNLLTDCVVSSEDGIPPVDLLEIQKLKTRQKDVYDDIVFRPLIENTPVLVFVENNEALDSEFREHAGHLRRAISRTVDFRLAAARNLEVVVSTFAKTLESKGSEERMHDPLVAALRLIFNDEEGDDRAHITAFLSPWKLAATAAVTSYVLQEVGQRLDRESTKDKAKAELKRLVGRLLHNAITAQEADFVSEMAKGVSKVVAGEFVNEGLNRIAKILGEETGIERSDLIDLPTKAGHFLKLLATIMQPFRIPPCKLPSIEEDIQRRLVTAIWNKLAALEVEMRKDAAERHGKLAAHSELTEPVLFLARLVQFDLGFPDVWSQKMKEVGDKLLSTVFSLAILHGGEYLDDPVAFSLLLDTAFYLFDEYPLEPRQPTVDLFQHCLKCDPSEFPSSMSLENRELLLTLLRYTPKNQPTDNLAYATRDSDGVLHVTSKVQARPWEWIENLGDMPQLDTKEKQKEAEEKERLKVKYVVKNNTSIPLDMFGAKLTGEGVRKTGKEGAENNLGEKFKSYFEEDLSAESIYERDWRLGESRLWTDRSRDGEVSGSKKRGGTPGSHRGSPALSVHVPISSRSSRSGPPSASSSRRTQSPVIGSRGEPMDVDQPAASNIRAGKRKASAVETIDEDDDVVYLGEGTSMKGKNVAGKSTKKTVGGKTTRKRK